MKKFQKSKQGKVTKYRTPNFFRGKVFTKTAALTKLKQNLTGKDRHL